MITLSKDNGFVKVERWEDIESLPGFVSNLNPSEHKLKAIIGRYIFKDYIKCGLSNCHTPHGKGYIATTMDGMSINIGKDCGKKYFGVDFESLSNKFDRDFAEAENRERLWSFSFQIEEIEDKINNLRQGKKGADWVYKQSQPLLRPGSGCPDEIVRRVSTMIKARTNTLTHQREATESEIEIAEVQAGRRVQRPYFVEESIAEIAGFEVLYPENNLKNLLIDDFETNLKSFKSKNIDILSFEELRNCVKWTGSVENLIETARKLTTLGSKLLSKENLEPFTRLSKTRDDIALFRSYLKSLEL